ncbi:hypothetical protein [Glutamicibacter sp.]|uniref:hypothetical protein n=1 Tax=Glutamicibacter sp. TaxID=1931995 RepID=UPI002B461D48|nr:hypothetical protein [Glutamicibacter sp.]HJX78544.1 hypothetical protein [Glutamicibacter sp.]
MSTRDVPFENVLDSIERATGCRFNAEDTVSFLADEEYSTYSWADISLRDLVTIIWNTELPA